MHSLPLRFEIPNVDDETIVKFLALFSMDLNTARTKIAGAQSYDPDFAYAMNPLKVSPLLQIDRGDHLALCAPVPPYLLQRFTEGIYYEIYDLPGFSAAFGTSFQNYVGDVVFAACQGGSVTLLPEKTYTESNNQKHSVDWIASDSSGDLFIECKTKRLTFASKIALASTDQLDNDLDKMAGFVVQTYKTLTHAKAGHYPHWKPRDLPIYPIIVTLEEWYAFGHCILKAIDDRVQEKLAESGLDPALMTEHPYVITSAPNFEICMQVINKHGIKAVLSALTSGEKRYWLIDTALSGGFSETYKQTQELFPDAFAALTARHKSG